jgi:hypothetical protein
LIGAPVEYPKRVRVVYSDGAEEVGTAIDPDHVDVGPMGLQVKLRDVVEIDGVPQLVVGFGQKYARDKAWPRGSDELLVRLRLKSIPDWWTSEERKK